VADVLEQYLNEDSPPDWLLGGIRELAWIFLGNPFTAAFVNAAVEVADRFVIERADKLTMEDIKEINYTMVPAPRVILILEEAFILERKGSFLVPGRLILRLRKVRDLNYTLASEEQKRATLEYQGILAITLLRSMLRDGSGAFVPQNALAIMTLLAAHALNSDDQIKPEVQKLTWDLAFRSLSSRQEKRTKRIMAGLLDGVAKIIEDLDVDGKPELKAAMIEYLIHERERFRQRERVRTV
jgi:hypothetical protein